MFSIISDKSRIDYSDLLNYFIKKFNNNIILRNAGLWSSFYSRNTGIG
jgi:hypothetical protein